MHTHNQQQETFFDQLAQKEDAKEWGSNVDKWQTVAHYLSPLPGGSRVLECGAGTGMYTLHMLKSGLRVTAVDLTDSALQIIRDIAAKQGVQDGLTTFSGDFLAVAKGFPAASFDLVTFFKVLHHFADIASIRDGIRQAYSLLKPGGRIVSLEPNGNCPLWKPWLMTRKINVNGQFLSYWEFEKNLSLIRARSLEEIFSQLPGATWELNYHYVLPASIINRYPRLLGPLDHGLSKTFLKRYSFNVSFEIVKPG